MSDRILSLAHLTVIELTPPEVVAAAAKVGFSHVGLRLRPPATNQPSPPLLGDTPMRREVHSLLADTGVKVLDTEAARLLPGTDVTTFEPLLETAAFLGARYIVVSAEIPDSAAMVDGFAAFCDIARRFGLIAAVEFMPWTAVRSLAEARALTEAAGRENGQILLDAIHLDRAGEGASDVSTALPAGHVAYLQLCDAPRERPSDMATMLHQARAARLPPGAGGLDLKGIVSVLPGDMPISIEVPMQERAKTVSAVTRAAELLASTRHFLQMIERGEASGLP
jgi:sugar phosphate isomerase/epimerase